jgi:hypothetical protein
MESTASLTLRKARLFLAQARAAYPNDHHATASNLEAAIVFCRSVTFHLQSQFAHSPGFVDWYAEQQNRLREQPLTRFMLDQRNYVLKVGSLITTRNVDLSITESLVNRGEISVQIIRGQPWYRRSPKTLIADLLYPLRQNVRLWQERRRWRRQAKESAKSSAVITRDALYFTDPEWKGTPALDLVDQQLTILADIVKQAEARFPVITS